MHTFLQKDPYVAQQVAIIFSTHNKTWNTNIPSLAKKVSFFYLISLGKLFVFKFST